MVGLVILGAVVMLCVIVGGIMAWLHYRLETRKLEGHPKVKAIADGLQLAAQRMDERCGELEQRVGTLEGWARGDLSHSALPPRPTTAPSFVAGPPSSSTSMVVHPQERE